MIKFYWNVTKEENFKNIVGNFFSLRKSIFIVKKKKFFFFIQSINCYKKNFEIWNFIMIVNLYKALFKKKKKNRTHSWNE